MERFLNKALLALLSILPIGIFIIKGWGNAIIFVSFIIAMSSIAVVYFQKFKKAKESTFSNFSNKSKHSPINTFWLVMVTIMLAFPVFAVSISQILRGTLYFPDYDGPLRFLLAIPIFYVVWKDRLNPVKYWQYTIALSIFITFIALPWLPKYYGLNVSANNARLGTYFVDPLTFGRLTLTFGLLLLFTINTFSKEKWYLITFKLICVAIAGYLSVKSGSRTGWMALPFVLVLLLWLYGPKNKIKATFAALILSMAAYTILYSVSPTVQNRTHEAIADLYSYKLHELNGESSLGERISFARMGWYYFELNPMAGWGHDGYKVHYDDPEISVYADQNTRHHPAEGGLFHNELTTNMVAFGIWGVIYTCLLFFVPLVLFISTWRKKNNIHICAFGIAYVICELVSSVSTEVFALKFTASFYAIFISCLCASVLADAGGQLTSSPRYA